MPTGDTLRQPQLLRVADAARRLNVSRRTAYRLVANGEVPAVRVGGSIRIDADELEQYVYGETPDTPTGGYPQGEQTASDRSPSDIPPRAQNAPEAS